MLRETGALIRFTLTGLAFKLPEELEIEGDNYSEMVERINRWVKAQGICEEFRLAPGRTPAELVQSRNELQERITYVDSVMYFNDGEPERHNTAEGVLFRLNKVLEMERKYREEDLRVDSDYEWGVMNGKLAALNWVVGYDWDDDD